MTASVETMARAWRLSLTLAAGGLCWALLCGVPVAGHVAPSAPPHPHAPRKAVEGVATTTAMKPHESLTAALIRAGVDAGDARAAAAAMADDFDTVNPHPGLTLRLEMSGGPNAKLAGLEVSPAEDRIVRLSRAPGGPFAVAREARPRVETIRVLDGAVNGSLYLSLVEAGASPDLSAMVVNLFGRDIDLSRDVQSGDRFRLVFRQRQGDGGAFTAPNLIYADVAGEGRVSRLYRVARTASGSDFASGADGARRSVLLRTPVDGARVSSPFGLRLHPILGFTRMHEGVDFAAGVGSPVFAAGSGVVEEARWSGGYGGWLKIRHASGLETGYGHLSAWAPGIAPGATVRQGQIVAYVGDSGLATGPHLHYEVFQTGRRVDPAAPSLRMTQRDVGDEAAVRVQKALIDATVASVTTG